MPVIETIGLTKAFKTRKAVDNVHLTVESGQIFGFLGPNGSGKTTTIGMLLGIIHPTSGAIKLFNSPDIHQARRRVGAILESPNFYPYLTGYENLKISAKIKRCPTSQIDKVIQVMGLKGREHGLVRTFSLGMKQRLAIASALLTNPDLVILDEPTNGLDPEGIKEIREVTKTLASGGKTIFLSSHLLSEVEQVCTHVAILKQGKVMRQGSIVELLSKHFVAAVKHENTALLLQTISEYDKTVRATVKDNFVHAELLDGNLSALNEFLAQKGLFVSHLSDRRVNLEESFFELTGSE
ncbi:ABC transporter-related protein [Chloroherpeton thalassium ATCC 35110]|uniref:ABC transporter-related protein n=1 Tax=Chloroherpeton thalassium (strain ATCC 35110 / GB-78) TaxID=517418 RepID=B3QRY1_CHLT3|nr:ABC transporter ATP-binding protein [Chloroherpeton thalassium]ACF13934.1 ABC transporter-related protein [Chloroherpeton thalassium ATCC 35110]